MGFAQHIPPPVIPPQEAILKSYRVQIAIENQIATVQIEQIYFNPTDRVLEGTYIFPVPKGTMISHLTLCSQDGCHEGKLLGADEARRLYEEIVRRTKDPALLEYLGERAFQVRVFPIPPHSEQGVKMSYQQVLPRVSGLVEVLYPLTSQKTIEQLLIQVRLKDDEPIGNVYSPSHTISQERLSESEVQVSFEGTHMKSDQDFRLYYALAQEGISLDLLSYRIGEEDGYFLLLASWPKVEVKPLPKDLVFVLDTSGSMSGEKLRQAKESLRHAMSRLNPDDRVGLVAFSDTLREFRSELVAASELDRTELEGFISSLEAAGGTNIHAALLRGLRLLEKDGARAEHPKILVFLTDGLPTVGETDIRKILKDISAKNEALKVRIFSFGVGYDVNTILLDTLSEENGGFSTYVEPGESLEGTVASFYDRVGNPLLWDLNVKFEGLQVYDLYPPELLDLFVGDMLQLVGRYRTAGKGSIILEGKGSGLAGSSGRFVREIELPAEATQYGFLPRIWAARAIGYLLKQIRLHGESPELVERVKQLAEKFGIVTPYTSYFAAPPSAPTDRSALQMSTGQMAVRASEALNALAYSASAEEVERFADQALKRIEGHTFTLREDRWVDSAYSGGPTVRIQFGSEAYFALASRSELRPYLTLGPQVTFSWKPAESPQSAPIFIEITDTGATGVDQLPHDLQQALAAPAASDKDVQSEDGEEPGVAAQQGPWAITLAIALAALLLVAGLWLFRR